MIYSQCEIEKNKKFSLTTKQNEISETIKKIEENVLKFNTEVHDIYEKNIHELLTSGRQKKIDKWHIFELDIDKIMFNSTLNNSERRQTIVQEIHEWLKCCENDVYVFEYNPQSNNAEYDNIKMSQSITGIHSKYNEQEIDNFYPPIKYLKIYFENKDDAMNFKLTWG